jgi:hypothetical protein
LQLGLGEHQRFGRRDAVDLDPIRACHHQQILDADVDTDHRMR